MGMPKIELRLQMFRGDWDQIWSQQRLLWAMEGLCRINQTHLRQMAAFKKRGLIERSYPPVYRSGLHYETEKGTEIWPDIPSLLTGVMGEGLYPGPWGDCEDLACYRVAELRELPWHFSRKVGGKVERADPRFPPNVKVAVSSSGQSPVKEMNEETMVTPGALKADVASEKSGAWKGWKREKGGIAAKPFAKWRRGPSGNYHYHALTLLPDGRLEDPSLVLGMGRERQFAADGTAQKLRSGEGQVVIQYAKLPDVMVVDPESPSGYAGGKAQQLDKKVIDLLKKGMTPEGVAISLGDSELGAFLSNTIPLSEGEWDVDAMIGWSRAEKRFSPKGDKEEARRLLGYSNH